MKWLWLAVPGGSIVLALFAIGWIVKRARQQESLTRLEALRQLTKNEKRVARIRRPVVRFDDYIHAHAASGRVRKSA